MVDFDKCKMTRYPDPVLAKTAKKIEKIDQNIKDLVEKMIDIMIENKGVGLAGPQAGQQLRIFIISTDTSRENVKVYINPKITPKGQTENIEEGCLSLPGIYSKIKRYQQCSVTATDLDGNQFSQDAEGLLARALQHEYDHIEGITILNRMGQVARIAARKKLKDLEEDFNNKEI